MTESEFAGLREAVLAHSTLHDSFDHGERHWRAVAYAGLRLAPTVRGCRPHVVLLFALFHDSTRENEYEDPEHGLRGGNLARRLNGELGFAGADDEELLFVACRDHTEPATSSDPTLGVCWDADRVNLWRVGITPREELLSTEPGRALVEEARGFHDQTHDWRDLARRFELLSRLAGDREASAR